MEQTNMDGATAHHLPEMAHTIKKYFDILITDADTGYAKTYELDKSIAFVRGIVLTSSRDDLMYYRGSQKIEINRLELFPEGYESKLLMFGINCPANERHYDTGKLPIGNAQVKVTYTDTSDGITQFIPYRVRVNLDCELVH